MSVLLDFANYLTSQRWFAGKGQKISGIECVANLSLVDEADWRILEVRYENGASEWYQVPWMGNGDAFAVEEFRRKVFALLGQGGIFSADRLHVRIDVFSPALPVNSSRLLTIEQSNSSVAYGDTSFLKIFRKLESGINPDIEILSYLTEAGTNVRVPKIHATMTLDDSGQSHALAVLLEMVPNRGNAWEIALEAAREGRDFRAEAGLLGRRTAELHLALASATENPAFGIRSSTPADGSDIWKNVCADTLNLRDLLSERLPNLSGESAARASAFIREASAQLARFSEPAVSFPLIRIHGDYHLGQVLAAGEDFVIIDFEGEPARSLEERRKHRSPLIDVAGMLRSFHYAGCTVGADDWPKGAAEAFLSTYFSITEGSPILPEPATTQALLELFSWQKKLYEIRYEMNNRPDWLWIPLR